MGLRLITPPTEMCMSLVEIKAALRVDHSDDDALLTEYGFQAGSYIEDYVQQRLRTQEWEFILDSFPTQEIRLPFKPVQSITSVKYDDAAGIEQTLDPSEYVLDNTSADAWLFFTIGWPTTLDAINSVRIRFVSGYPTEEEIPPSIKAAFRLKVEELFDQQDNTAGIKALLQPHTRMFV